MSFMDKGSRSASDEDVCACPNCGQMEHIIVMWERNGDKQLVSVGCSKCDSYVTAQDWSLAYVEWNIQAFDKKGNDGDPDKEHVYRLFHRKFIMQREMKLLDKQIDDFVTSTYMPRSQLHTGDRFEAFDWSPGKWEIIEVTANYGINTGQFYIIKAVELLPSGRRGHHTAEFWSDRMGEIHLLDNFVSATKWSMLHKGDVCRLHGKEGKITVVNKEKRIAIIQIEGKRIPINKLENLEVDKCRLT